MLVERLVVDGVAELLVGVHTDAVFGPVLSLGTGGVLTELVRDVAHLLLPVDARPRSAAPCSACAAPRCSPGTGARRLPTSTSWSPSSSGWSSWSSARRRWSTLEINPLIVTATGAWACDALLVTSGAERE